MIDHSDLRKPVRLSICKENGKILKKTLSGLITKKSIFITIFFIPDILRLSPLSLSKRGCVKSTQMTQIIRIYADK
jgi:hypothetical protein